MKSSEILLRAAATCQETQTYGCVAIYDVIDLATTNLDVGDKPIHRRKLLAGAQTAYANAMGFFERFKPVGLTEDVMDKTGWFGPPGNWINQDRRIDALHAAAALALQAGD